MVVRIRGRGSIGQYEIVAIWLNNYKTHSKNGSLWSWKLKPRVGFCGPNIIKRLWGLEFEKGMCKYCLMYHGGERQGNPCEDWVIRNMFKKICQLVCICFMLRGDVAIRELWVCANRYDKLGPIGNRRFWISLSLSPSLYKYTYIYMTAIEAQILPITTFASTLFLIWHQFIPRVCHRHIGRTKLL